MLSIELESAMSTSGLSPRFHPGSAPAIIAALSEPALVELCNRYLYPVSAFDHRIDALRRTVEDGYEFELLDLDALREAQAEDEARLIASYRQAA